MFPASFYHAAPGLAYHIKKLADHFMAEDAIGSKICNIYSSIDPDLYEIMPLLINDLQNHNCAVLHCEDDCMGQFYSIRIEYMTFKYQLAH